MNIRKALIKICKQRDSYEDTRAWLDAVLHKCPVDHLDQDTLSLLVRLLRGTPGAEYAVIRDEFDEHLRFWEAMARRFPDHAELIVIQGDTLLMAGREVEAIDMLFHGLELDPSLLGYYGEGLDDLFRERGQEELFRYHIIRARQYLLEAEQYRSDDETVAEALYENLRPESEDPAYLERIRKVAAPYFESFEKNRISQEKGGGWLNRFRKKK